MCENFHTKYIVLLHIMHTIHTTRQSTKHKLSKQNEPKEQQDRERQLNEQLNEELKEEQEIARQQEFYKQQISGEMRESKIKPIKKRYHVSPIVNPMLIQDINPNKRKVLCEENVEQIFDTFSSVPCASVSPITCSPEINVPSATLISLEAKLRETQDCFLDQVKMIQLNILSICSSVNSKFAYIEDSLKQQQVITTAHWKAITDQHDAITLQKLELLGHENTIIEQHTMLTRQQNLINKQRSDIDKNRSDNLINQANIIKNTNLLDEYIETSSKRQRSGSSSHSNDHRK